MIVAGVMSGTSADGIDVALVQISGLGFATRLRLLHHFHRRFPAGVREQIVAVMNASAAVADLARLNFMLGELYAEAVVAAERSSRVKAELVGCHGQTIYHQGEPGKFLGHQISATWQTGEAAVIAARTRVPVASDFRVADMANGGKGAPLVPFLDYLLYRDKKAGRIVQNLGGIANLTAIPAGAKPASVIAFDTGPGNMVIDGVAQAVFGKPMDTNGRFAARGRVDDALLRWAMGRQFFSQPPPKTAGREEFGREFVSEFLKRARKLSKHDTIATATAFTARSIRTALENFVLTGKRRYSDYLVSGGGTRNATLMLMLKQELAPLGLAVASTDAMGLPSQAKEAVAFAVLAYQTWHRQPSNIPSATGASRPAVLGKISYA
ncbi:MAG TPA: anhydro-N-acetylmuramic acid kinase [Terriglobales bacterium]|nr:anhydro-N-acetylmuramic acid kinase [Terriglobales bacterium]